MAKATKTGQKFVRRACWTGIADCIGWVTPAIGSKPVGPNSGLPGGTLMSISCYSPERCVAGDLVDVELPAAHGHGAVPRVEFGRGNGRGNGTVACRSNADLTTVRQHDPAD